MYKTDYKYSLQSISTQCAHKQVFEPDVSTTRRMNVCRRIYIVLSRNISAGMNAFEYNSTTLLEIVKFTYAEPKLIAQNVHISVCSSSKIGRKWSDANEIEK